MHGMGTEKEEEWEKEESKEEAPKARRNTPNPSEERLRIAHLQNHKKELTSCSCSSSSPQAEHPRSPPFFTNRIFWVLQQCACND